MADNWSITILVFHFISQNDARVQLDEEENVKMSNSEKTTEETQGNPGKQQEQFCSMVLSGRRRPDCSCQQSARAAAEGRMPRGEPPQGGGKVPKDT